MSFPSRFGVVYIYIFGDIFVFEGHLLFATFFAALGNYDLV